ncbi:MAG: LytTR family DNA-binding domain-containing protein [Dyadobacter sp.]|uniref:LytR/AlgR family response regulator transcription factor n=1 Tax=Dyadobacter sp. TaxID=1914288 RepID=UPI0032671E76
MINCLIVDDAPVAREILVGYCRLLPVLRVVGQCSDAFEAREKIQQLPVDLLLMDINMPMLSGIELLKTLKNPPLVVFTTAYKEFATDAFDLAACDYLLKPFSIERFIIAIDRVVEKMPHKTSTIAEIPPAVPSHHLLLRTEGRINKLNYDQIVYLEASRNNTKVITSSEHFISTTPLSSIETQLPAELFFRVHRSFIINLSKVTSLHGNRIMLGKSEVPLGGNYRIEFLKLLGL